jgi:hypothetical protein
LQKLKDTVPEHGETTNIGTVAKYTYSAMDLAWNYPDNSALVVKGKQSLAKAQVVTEREKG